MPTSQRPGQPGSVSAPVLGSSGPCPDHEPGRL